MTAVTMMTRHVSLTKETVEHHPFLLLHSLHLSVVLSHVLQRTFRGGALRDAVVASYALEDTLAYDVHCHTDTTVEGPHRLPKGTHVGEY